MPYKKIIIAGSRDFGAFSKKNEHFTLLCQVMHKLTKSTGDVSIISGAARGADQMGELYAQHNKLHVISKPADWDTHGKSAGYKRNAEMADIATHCVIFWDGKSRGSKHMIDLAGKKQIPTVIVYYDETPVRYEFKRPNE
jgi:hypothetical protein